jgi:hypothetical protein
MAQFTRKTFNDAYGNYLLGKEGPGGFLQFARNRRAGPWGGTVIETGLNIATAGRFGAWWSFHWGVASLPGEIGRAIPKSLNLLERLGRGQPEFAGPIVDTRMAYTMRQSALQAMHNSAYSLKGAIGNEARLLHR